jgi:hypothetical protein
MTARIQECLYFGAIPVGFFKHNGIDKYLPKELIANNSDDLEKIINKVNKMSIQEKQNYRNNLWKQLEFMDVSNFIDKLEGV